MAITNLDEQLEHTLLSLPKTVLLDVMMSALSEMQHYNGRTNTEAILKAINAEEHEKKDGGTAYKLPSRRKLIEDFS